MEKPTQAAKGRWQQACCACSLPHGHRRTHAGCHTPRLGPGARSTGHGPLQQKELLGSFRLSRRCVLPATWPRWSRQSCRHQHGEGEHPADAQRCLLSNSPAGHAAEVEGIPPPPPPRPGPQPRPWHPVRRDVLSCKQEGAATCHELLAAPGNRRDPRSTAASHRLTQGRLGWQLQHPPTRLPDGQVFFLPFLNHQESYRGCELQPLAFPDVPVEAVTTRFPARTLAAASRSSFSCEFS